jgi:hypothetical protein
MSLTNCAWSQTGVADAAGCNVAAGSVGTDKGVLVTTDSGSVGVLNGTVLVSCACTVRAAAVNTALASAVGVAALEGKLQAESMKMKTISMERMRASLNI